MSYDICLIDNKGKTVVLSKKHDISGGTYAVGGTEKVELNITYNYATIFHKVIKRPDDIPCAEGDYSELTGIQALYGLTAKQAIPVLIEARLKLNGLPHDDYWKATEGNVKAALLNLLRLCKLAYEDFPNAVWSGD